MKTVIVASAIILALPVCIATGDEFQQLGRLLVDLQSSNQGVTRNAARVVAEVVRKLDSSTYDGFPIMDDSRRRYCDVMVPLLPQWIALARSRNVPVAVTSIHAIQQMCAHGRNANRALRHIASDGSREGAVRLCALQAQLLTTPPGQVALGRQWEMFIRLKVTADDSPLHGGKDDISRSAYARAARAGLVADLIWHDLMLSGHAIEEVPYLLATATSDCDASTRALAVLVLGRLEAEAGAARSGLMSLLDDSEEFVRVCAGTAILRHRPEREVAKLVSTRLMLGREDTQMFVDLAEAFAEERADLQRLVSGGVIEFPGMTVVQLRFDNPARRRVLLRLFPTSDELSHAVKSELNVLARNGDVVTSKLATELLGPVGGQDVKRASSRAGKCAGRRIIRKWRIRWRGPFTGV